MVQHEHRACGAGFHSRGQQAATHEYVENCGGIGICFQTGYEKERSTRATVTERVPNILADQGLLKAAAKWVVGRDIFFLARRVK